MFKQFSKADYILWSVITVYTGIIYATLNALSVIRKALIEKFGAVVFDWVYWIFGCLAVVAIVYCVKMYHGKRLFYKFISLGLISGIYIYYLTGMDYPIERIHFLEYGLLGALVYIAVARHIKHWIALIISAQIVYWLGLGDEAIQGILAGRVGEIRDSITDLFSGALGISLIALITNKSRISQVLKTVYCKIVLIVSALTTLFTALFLITVHGFGYCLQSCDPGIVYSAFSPAMLTQINSAEPVVSSRDLKTYENEALRHLFQREFYFTNDFKASNGTIYRLYAHSFYENRILEKYYPRFLEQHAGQLSGGIIKHIEPDVARGVVQNPVIWSDSLRSILAQTVKHKTALYKSRVKEVIITSFTFQDLAFYCALIVLVLGYVWFRLPKQKIICNDK